MRGVQVERAHLTRSLARYFRRAAQVRGEGYVDAIDGEIDRTGRVSGTVQGSRAAPYRIQMMPAPNDPRVLVADCSCPAAELDPCKHLWAALIKIDLSGTWPDDVEVPVKLELGGLAVARAPHTAMTPRLPPPPPPPTWRDRLGFWPRDEEVVPGGKLAEIEYLIAAAPLPALPLPPRPPRVADDRTCVVLRSTVTRTKHGVRRKLGSIAPSRLGPIDAELQSALFGIEDVGDVHGHGGRYHAYGASVRRTGVRIDARRVGEVLPRLAATGRFGWTPDDSERLAPLVWDGAPWALEVRLRRRGAQVVADGAAVRGDERIPLEALAAIAGAGLAISGDRLIQLEIDELGRWWTLLAGGLELPAGEVGDLLAEIGRQARGPRLELGDVGWEVVEAPLTRRIVIEARGRSGYEASAELHYGDQPVEPGGAATTIDREARRLVRRRIGEERQAALQLRALGGWLDRAWPVAAPRLRELIEGGAARGWEVWYGGAAVRSTAAVSAKVTSGVDWFDLALQLGDDGASAEVPELLSALRGGKPLVRLSDGTTAMIPTWLEARAAALTAAPQAGGALRFRTAEVLMVAAMLDGVAEAKVDAGFARLRDRLDGFAGLAPRDAPRGFGATLRDYQRDGLGWLHFLRELGLGGCLADDMGLGKTVQVLALLDGLRRDRKPRSRKPALIVAPRSLVFHWLDEARRFAPRLRTLEWHGAGRAQRAGELAGADMIVTTYATLRQDLEHFGALELGLVVLDEAQAIKTATTATAKAVRALRADHRLALTGTPVENRLDDLASIFEFLNPGLLGRPAALRAVAGVDGEVDRARALGRVLRPFLLRRTKQQVLAELPAKTEQIIGCRLEGAERKRYDELRLHYRRALLPAVERDGVGRNTIVVLEALLRLRQAALHPGLLDPRRAGDDSAKLDALIEHLGEVIASGHRALVFSQFTTLLGIVRARLEREGIAHEYLDGKTRDRQERVAAFQGGDASVFLLSLKAGGTGLNLTAADHVFLLDPWWNPAVEAQAIDRVHRIGQQRPVTAYRLVAEDTVEQKILDLQAHKRALYDGVFEDKGVVSRLTADDLRALLD